METQETEAETKIETLRQWLRSGGWQQVEMIGEDEAGARVSGWVPPGGDRGHAVHEDEFLFHGHNGAQE